VEIREYRILVSLWKELERFIGKFPGTAKKILDGRAISAYLFIRIPVGSMLPIQRP
jgi:hypothetical protein